MDEEDLPNGWTIWHHVEGDRLILTFHPDIFDGVRFPPACLPTIYVREGEQDLRRPGPDPAPGTENSWRVRLYLEPDVANAPTIVETWSTAVDEAIGLATSFSAGEIDVRDMYQVPRDTYLAEIESLIAARDETSLS